jgi:hypothetical protein
MLAGGTFLLELPGFVGEHGWLRRAEAADLELVRETVGGLIAFIVPGPDAYSVAQGVSTAEPGGIDAGITDMLITLLDQSQPVSAGAPPLSAVVATVLNGVAQAVNPGARGAFRSPFARLSFGEKVAVFAYLESDPSTEGTPLRPLAGFLPVAVAFAVYSEGAVDPALAGPTRRPIGWRLSEYDGIADGRPEFKGYYQDRRRAER